MAKYRRTGGIPRVPTPVRAVLVVDYGYEDGVWVFGGHRRVTEGHDIAVLADIEVVDRGFRWG